MTKPASRTEFLTVPCKYQRTAHRMISAVNCRPLNESLLLRFTVSPSQSPPVVTQTEPTSKLQQNRKG